MSKEEKQEQKNYADYTYIGDETITMTVQEFVAIQKALDQAISNGVIAQHPQVVKWFDKKTGKPVETPTDKQISEGKVQQFADAEATKSEQNLQILYNANLFPTVFNGREVAMSVHGRMVEEGVAKPLAEVKAAYEERKAKGQMKIQEDEEAPKGTMNVVREEEDKQ